MRISRVPFAAVFASHSLQRFRNFWCNAGFFCIAFACALFRFRSKARRLSFAFSDSLSRNLRFLSGAVAGLRMTGPAGSDLPSVKRIVRRSSAKAAFLREGFQVLLEAWPETIPAALCNLFFCEAVLVALSHPFAVACQGLGRADFDEPEVVVPSASLDDAGVVHHPWSVTNNEAEIPRPQLLKETPCDRQSAGMDAVATVHFATGGMSASVAVVAAPSAQDAHALLPLLALQLEPSC